MTRFVARIWPDFGKLHYTGN